MPIRIVRLGSARTEGEGLRIGTVRRPPRGIARRDFARLDYFDVWLPELAPSASVVSWGMSEPWTAARWAQFARRYRREMREPQPQRLIAMLAALSQQTDFAVGCYCEDATHCHRSMLAKLLEESGAKIDFAS